jgi:hypothetical protein
MKKFIVCIIFCLTAGSFVFAQSPLDILNKVKEIKFLESTREDVEKILASKASDAGKNVSEYYPARHMKIYVEYSSGDCSDWDENWHVTAGKAKRIKIIFNKSVSSEYLAVDLSTLKKEQIFMDSTDYFIYHNKGAGIGYEVYKSRIRSISLLPSKESYSFFCKNKKADKFYSRENWYAKKFKIKKMIFENYASVDNLTLSLYEITSDCTSDKSASSKSCTDSNKLITVFADAASSDENDILTYNYKISGGEIIGTGEEVVWDLSGVKPGKYTITVSVDNGCGICGTTRTEEVIVKECPGCKEK